MPGMKFIICLNHLPSISKVPTQQDTIYDWRAPQMKLMSRNIVDWHRSAQLYLHARCPHPSLTAFKYNMRIAHNYTAFMQLLQAWGEIASRLG